MQANELDSHPILQKGPVEQLQWVQGFFLDNGGQPPERRTARIVWLQDAALATRICAGLSAELVKRYVRVALRDVGR